MSTNELRHIVWEHNWFDIFVFPQVFLRQDTYAIFLAPRVRENCGTSLIGALPHISEGFFVSAMALLVEVSNYHMGACPLPRLPQAPSPSQPRDLTSFIRREVMKSQDPPYRRTTQGNFFPMKNCPLQDSNLRLLGSQLAP